MGRRNSQKAWLTPVRNNAERKKRLLREAWRKGYFAGVVPVANAMSVSQLLSAPPRANIPLGSTGVYSVSAGCTLPNKKLREKIRQTKEPKLFIIAKAPPPRTTLQAV